VRLIALKADLAASLCVIIVNRVAYVALRRLRCLLPLPRPRHVLEIIPAVIHRFFENSPSY